MTEATSAPTLSTIERVIYERLQFHETPISVLYHVAFGVPHRELPKSSRIQQQRLGPYVTRLNKKLEPREKVVPGVARRTYRLESLTVGG